MFDALKKGTNVKRQKLKSDNHELVDQAIFNWFLNMQSQNVPLSASMIQEKAVICAKELNTENFQASDGWLRGWKERNNISFKAVSGESKSVTPEMVNAWSETSLPTLLSNYDLKDIYNADEFGLFYQCLPNKTCQLESEKCYGGKLSKIHITGSSKCYGQQVTRACHWEGQESTMLQKCQVFTLPLQKSTKKLDGWEII